MNEKVTMEEVVNSTTQWWWVGWEPRDPEEPWTYRIYAITCDDGVNNNYFSTPSFGASNKAAWLFENGRMNKKNGFVKTFTKEQIYAEQFDVD